MLAIERQETVIRDLEQALAVRPMPAEIEQRFGTLLVEGRLAQRVLEREPGRVDSAALLLAVSRGRWAREKLVEYNLPLVQSIARRYANRGLDLEDLRQEGTIGLMRAIDGFDWARGLRLSTYATWWIRQAVTRAIADRGRLIRLPVNAQETLAQMLAAAAILAAKHSGQPAIDAIAGVAGVTPDRAVELLSALGDAVSFELTTGPEGRPLHETIGDSSPGPEDLACESVSRQGIEALLGATLSSREAEVIRLRHGLADGITWTLENIGARLGVTRERARQLEASALAKLRDAAVAGPLRELVAA